MGDEDDGLAEFGLQPKELLLKLRAYDRVDSAEGLVHQPHLRICGECASYTDALLLTTGKLRGVTLGELGIQPNPLKKLHRPVAGLATVLTEQQRNCGDVVNHRAVREQSCVLDHIAD